MNEFYVTRFCAYLICRTHELDISNFNKCALKKFSVHNENKEPNRNLFINTQVEFSFYLLAYYLLKISV